jgi:hypothetical protein
MKVAFTEQHSDWVRPMLAQMDFSYQLSFLRQEIRGVVPMRPSEYWERQCFLGASTTSRAEVRARRSIGIDKMMLGFDYPHFEGAWRAGTAAYLRATLGDAGVPADEARQMLGTTAAHVFRLDLSELDAVARQIGPTVGDVLRPGGDELPPGRFDDIERPLMTVG